MLSLTKNKPKALLKLPNNKTLLLSQLEVFSNFSTISEIIIVVGYFAEKIEKKLNNEYLHPPPHYEYSPNNCYESQNK